MQNAIKVFSHWAPSLMNIVKATDPSTVTQHGLYMRPLGDSPMVDPPQAAPPGPPTPAQTPPETREQTPPPTPTKSPCTSTPELPSTTAPSRASAIQIQNTKQTPDKSSYGDAATSSQLPDSAEVEAASAKASLPKAASSTKSLVHLEASPCAHTKVDPIARSDRTQFFWPQVRSQAQGHARLETTFRGVSLGSRGGLGTRQSDLARRCCTCNYPQRSVGLPGAVMCWLGCAVL